MQRINFTESTLNTLKKTANCSFANAVYKLTMKAQQGLKCDDLYKKSVLMNDVNKILCNYKLDECIIFQPELSAYGPSINFPSGGDDTTEYSFYQNDLLISDSYTNEDIVNYFLNLGFGSIGQVPLINPNFIQNPSGWEANNYNSSTQNLYTTNINLYYTLFNTISSPISSEFFNPAYSEEVADAYAISGNIETVYSLVQNSNGNEGNIVWVKIIVRPETCVDYTEEQLNCITPQDLQVLYEFTHKYKETLAKSTKKISNPSSSANTSNSSDCCTWGSIGGNIGNQSDLVTYLANIEKNYISVEDEGTEITDDVKSINFTGNVTASDDGNGNVTVNVTGGGGTTPDLQQVTDVGFTTTNKLSSDDGAGNSTTLNNGVIKIQTGNTGEVDIDASLVTASYVAQLPDKATGPQTFAMLSDLNNIQTFKQVISSADIKNGVAISLLPAPGAGKAITIIEASIKLDGNTPYAGAIGVFAIYPSLSGTLAKTLYNSGANTFFNTNSGPSYYKMIDTNTNTGFLSPNIFENESISARVFWSTPPAGAGNVGVTVYGSYRIIDL